MDNSRVGGMSSFQEKLTSDFDEYLECRLGYETQQ